MLLIRCPYCNETLPEAEFTYAGEAHVTHPGAFKGERDVSTIDDARWEAFLYLRENVKGPHHERWRHTHGCGRFFNAVRDTVTDRFLTTYEAGAPRPNISDLTGSKP